MSQASNRREEALDEFENNFGQFMISVMRNKQHTVGTRLDRMALVILGTLTHHGPARLTTVADLAGFDASTVSRQVADLEKAGLLSREPDPDDRRAAVLKPTVAGEALMQRLKAGRRRRLTTLVQSWSCDEVSTFGRLLGELNKASEEHADEFRRELEEELNG